MSILKEQVEKANTELAKRWVRILYLEDVVSSQNSVNLRQASEILGNRGAMRDLQRQLAEVTRERDALQAALKLADALRNREREQCHHYTLANGRDMAINFREA